MSSIWATEKEPMTKKPCEGCGKQGKRPVGKVCWQCAKLLKDAREAKEIASADPDLVKAIVPEEIYYPTNISSYYDKPGAEYNRIVASAMAQLIHSLKVTNTIGHYQLENEEIKIMPGQYVGSFGRRETLMMHRKYAEILSKLDQAIRDFVTFEYKAGVREGTNILSKISKGELTYQQVDKIMEDRELE